jgi:hypothetical protein
MDDSKALDGQRLVPWQMGTLAQPHALGQIFLMLALVEEAIELSFKLCQAQEAGDEHRRSTARAPRRRHGEAQRGSEEDR